MVLLSARLMGLEMAAACRLITTEAFLNDCYHSAFEPSLLLAAASGSQCEDASRYACRCQFYTHLSCCGLALHGASRPTRHAAGRNIDSSVHSRRGIQEGPK